MANLPKEGPLREHLAIKYQLDKEYHKPKLQKYLMKQSKTEVMLQSKKPDKLKDQVVTEKLSEQYNNLAKIDVLPPKTPKKLPGWQIHDFKYKNRNSVKDLKLEPLDQHKLRLMKIKKI